MLTYLDANLHPEKYAARATPGSAAATLPAAIALEHEARADGGPGVAQALAWGIDLETHSLGHGGATDGYTSWTRLAPDQDWAVIVLYNRFLDGGTGDFQDRVGENVSALLSGKPGMPLDFMCEADKRGLAHLGIQ
jgi:D-alanyl-D-alanine-carboxypeptidase/D-alanyl-D-alanine-endopeptidase